VDLNKISTSKGQEYKMRPEVFIVYAGVKGTQGLRSHTLEHHEKLITGIVLIGLGILAVFVEL
jgi:hypothetical protein